MPRHRSAAAAAAVEPPSATPVSSEPEPPPKVEMEPPTGAAAPSLVHEVLSLKRSWESKKEAAIQELLQKRTEIEKQFNENLKEIEDQLAELGYTREPDFVPVPASRVQPFRKARAKSAKRQLVCPICTVDSEEPVFGHDGRAHKSQKRKRPFTAAELAARS